MMQVRDAVEEYRYSILQLTRRTQNLNTQRLKEFAAWCDLAGVTMETLKPTDVTEFLETVRVKPHHYTGKTLSTYTVHGYAATIKAFLNWAAKEELIALSIPRRLAMPRIETKVIEVYTDEQIKALLRACEKEKDIALEVRDRAIISVLLDTGIRANELCSLTLDNVFLNPNEAYLKVYGKGSKQFGSVKAEGRYLDRSFLSYQASTILLIEPTF